MKYAKITLSGGFSNTGSQVKSLFTKQEKRFRFDEFLIRVEKILGNRKITRVLIECKRDFHFRLYSGAEDMREQFFRLKEGGKEVFFYASSYDTTTLYLASACGTRLIHPLGTLSFLGLSRSFLFFKGTMEKYGMESEVIRRGEYKSAGDRFRTDRLDSKNREQYEVYLETVMEEMREGTAEGIGKSREEIEQLEEGRILDAGTAQSEGWINRAVTIRNAEEQWKEEERGKQKKIKRIGRHYGRGRKKIAVLVFEGAIIDGKSKYHPLAGEAIGSDSFLPHIEKLRKDKKIKGVVLLVNSGGGSATASEDILDAL
ncbi:MAG: S49 family peptidase, partial [Spirochaetaceae bacterium]